MLLSHQKISLTEIFYGTILIKFILDINLMPMKTGKMTSYFDKGTITK